MGYYIELLDPVTKETLLTEEPHHMRGATYAIGGTTEMSLSVTYNYSDIFYSKLDTEKGFRGLYGKTGAESIPILKEAISKLADDVHDNYWEATEGNAKRALTHLLALAKMRPDGVWDGD